MVEKCSALILSGGLSSRMHFPKAYLLYRNSTFAETIIREYWKAGIRDIKIVMNHRLCGQEWSGYFNTIRAQAMVLENNKPENGRSYSLLLGLKSLLPTGFCFLQNVDTPYVDANLIRRLFASRNENGTTVPTYIGRHGHPVLLSTPVIREIISKDREDINLKELLQNYPRTCVEVPNEEILLNINTPDDYFSFLKLQTA